jgi:hypothetical protein
LLLLLLLLLLWKGRWRRLQLLLLQLLVPVTIASITPSTSIGTCSSSGGGGSSRRLQVGLLTRCASAGACTSRPICWCLWCISRLRRRPLFRVC